MTTLAQAAAAFSKSDQKLLEGWYDAKLRAETGIGMYEAQSVPIDYIRALVSWAEHKGVKQSICVDWDFCAKIKSMGPTVELVLALSNFIMTQAEISLAPEGAADLAVLLIKQSVCKLCDCE